jgi:hypothetical protein
MAEDSMVEQIFGALFLATLFVPPAALIVGVFMLAWPRRREVPRHQRTMEHAHA